MRNWDWTATDTKYLKNTGLTKDQGLNNNIKWYSLTNVIPLNI